MAGCGYVGGSLAARLSAEGYSVWGLRRSPGPVPEGVRPVVADITDPSTLHPLPRDLNLAVILLATGGGGDADYHALYVRGLGHLLSALERHSPGLERVIFISSTGVYGDHRGGWVDEASPVEPAIDAGRALVEAERLLSERPFRSVVVRFSGIYGPGRTRLVRTVQSGQARIAPGPPRYLNQIHRDDCVGVLYHLLKLPRPAPVYLATDHEPAPRREILTWIARRLGVPAPAVAHDAPAAPGSGRGNKRCRNTLLAESGYRFVHPTYREGYAGLVPSTPPRP